MLPPDGQGRWDCVVFQKSYRPDDIALALRLKARGVRIVTDLCDNHLYNPDSSPELDQRAAGMQRMIDLADVVTVSTPTLARHLGTRHTLLVDDALDRPLLGRLRDRPWRSARRPSATPLRIVWFGNSGETSPPFGLVDLGAIVGELAVLHSRRRLVLTVVTDSKPAVDLHLGDAPFPVAYVPWRARTFASRAGPNHVCVLPVTANPLTECKSNNRLITSLMLGVPVVAGRIPSYEELGDWALFEDWAQNVERYAENPDLRRAHVGGGQRHIETTYTPGRVVAQWEAAISEAL